MKKAVVVYDGDCGICEKCRNLIDRLDWLNKFECRSGQDQQLYQIYPTLSYDECQKELKLVEDSKIYGGADAVIRICRKLPLVMPIGWLFSIPPLLQLARWLYPIVANNRYRISAQCGLRNRD